MQFDVIVGNPPYGRDRIGSRRLHFRIMGSSVPFCAGTSVFVMPSKCIYDTSMGKERSFLAESGCETIEIVDGSAFVGTQMPDPAIYVCRKGSVECDQRLLGDGNLFADDIERRIFSLMDTGRTMYSRTVISYGDWSRDYYNWNKWKDLEKMGMYSWFVNVGYSNYREDGDWFPQKPLKETGILDLDGEIGFIKSDKTPKIVLGLGSRMEAENVWNLLHTNLMRFCLWICQDDRNMKRKTWRLFPDLDYSEILDDSELLRRMGCGEDEIEGILEYVWRFDFSKRRKDRFLKSKKEVV